MRSSSRSPLPSQNATSRSTSSNEHHPFAQVSSAQVTQILGSIETRVPVWTTPRLTDCRPRLLTCKKSVSPPWRATTGALEPIPSPEICAGERSRSQSTSSSSETAGEYLTSAVNVPDAISLVDLPKNSSGSCSVSNPGTLSRSSVVLSGFVSWISSRPCSGTGSIPSQAVSISDSYSYSSSVSGSDERSTSEDSSCAAKPWPSANATSADVCWK